MAPGCDMICGPHFVSADVEESRLVLGGAVKRDQADRRRARGIVGKDHRRQCARRHGGEFPARERIHFGERTAAIDVAAEIVADDADADDRPRFQPPAARGLADAALEPRRDVLLDAGGRHAAVEDQGLDGRAAKDRQDIDRDRRSRQAAEHDERQHHHRDGNRVLERGADQAVHGRAIRSGVERIQGGRGSKRLRARKEARDAGAVNELGSLVGVRAEPDQQRRQGRLPAARPSARRPNRPGLIPESDLDERAIVGAELDLRAVDEAVRAPRRRRRGFARSAPSRKRAAPSGCARPARERSSPCRTCLLASSPLGLGRSISTRIVRVVGSSDSAIRETVPVKISLPRASTAKLCRVSHAGDDDVAVGNLDDHPHQVGSLDGQQRRLPSLGGRAHERARVKRAVGHHAVERRDDPRVIDVHTRTRQPGLATADSRLRLGQVGA